MIYFDDLDTSPFSLNNNGDEIVSSSYSLKETCHGTVSCSFYSKKIRMDNSPLSLKGHARHSILSEGEGDGMVGWPPLHSRK